MPVPIPLRVVVLMPVYNDWVSVSLLVERIAQTIRSYQVGVLLVDDGSTERWREEDFRRGTESVENIEILRLRRNVGHQRAIAIGLVHIYKTTSCDAILVMDSDGEDTLEGAADLFRSFVESGGEMAIFAERSRRSESAIFRLFYRAYKVLHRLLTGMGVKVGNFSILPFSYLETMVAVPELWNHYAAAVLRSRKPFRMIPIPRGTRIAGTSQMKFVSLVTHGLSAISVFSDIVGVRLLIACCTAAMFVIACIAIIVAVRFLTDMAIPGWATATIAALAIIFIQIITIATSFTFFMLSNRNTVGFIPLRDYCHFIAESIHVCTHA